MGEFDIATETTTKALKKFTQSVYDGRRGLATQKEAFEALGITMEDLNNLSTWELLDRVGEGMRMVTDTTKKSGAAMALFGQRSVAVADGLGKINLKSQEYVDSIRKTGIATSLELKALQDYIKGTDEMADIMETKGLSAAAKLAKGLLDIKGAYTDLKVAFADSFLPDFVREALLMTADLLDRLDGSTTKSRSQLAIISDEAAFERSIKGFADAADKEKSLIAELTANRERLTERMSGLDYGSRIHKQAARALNEINDDISNANERYKVALDDRRVMEERYLKWQKENGLFVGPIRPEGAAATIGGQASDAQVENEVAKLMRGIGVGGGLTGPQMANVVRSIRQREREAEIQERFLRQGRGERFNVAMSQQQMDATGASEMERFLRTGRNERFSQQLAEAEKGIIKLSDETKNRLEPVITGLDSKLENFFSSIIDGSKSAGDAFKNLAASIADAVFQALVLQPLINTITGGIGSALGVPVPPRASGGPVSARNPYIVGEKGPELFVPNHAGTIVPNGEMMGGTSFAWNVNIQSTDGPGVRKALAEARPLFQQDAIEAVSNAARRPGGLRG